MQLYQLSFPNGKSYIGITSKTAHIRFKEHCLPSKNRNACQHAIHAYGVENVSLTVLATVDNWELLCLAEMEAIEKFKAFYKNGNGYNLTLGGEGVLTVDIHGKERITRDRFLSAAYQKAWREANKAKLDAYGKTYRAANKDNKSAINKAWREAHKDKKSTLDKSYREANRDMIIAKERAWREANRDMINAKQKQRRAAKKLEAQAI